MTHQLTKGNLEISNLWVFSICFKNAIRIKLNFDFGLLRNEINQWIWSLIKALTKVISKTVTRGVTALLLKKKSRLEIYERWGKRNDKRCIDCITRTHGRLKGGRLLNHSCHFSFWAWATWHLVESNCARSEGMVAVGTARALACVRDDAQLASTRERHLTRSKRDFGHGVCALNQHGQWAGPAQAGAGAVHLGWAR
jgi:hypothetical protein